MESKEETQPQTIRVAKVYRFENGMCMVFGFDGLQIPELQGPWEKSAELLKALHVDTSKTIWDLKAAWR